MSNQGSGGNVLAALCSFFIPGLGQLLQGRGRVAVSHFILTFISWCLILVVIGIPMVIGMCLYSAYEAAKWEPEHR